MTELSVLVLRRRILGKPLLLIWNFDNPYNLGKGLDRNDVNDANKIYADPNTQWLNLPVILQFLHIIRCRFSGTNWNALIWIIECVLLKGLVSGSCIAGFCYCLQFQQCWESLSKFLWYKFIAKSSIPVKGSELWPIRDVHIEEFFGQNW